MDLSVYGDRSPGRLLKQKSGEAAYYAFVPGPLPPNLQFDLPLVNLLAEATSALGELGGLARTLANPYLFVRPFIRREAVASSRIEGTEADINDLFVYEAGQRVMPAADVAAPKSDVREVYNYVEALDYGIRRLAEFPLSLRLMREIHERLLDGVRGKYATPGEFRTTQNWIGDPGCLLNDASYVPPPVSEMLAALSDLERYLHRDDDPYPPIVRLALIHYQLEAIHPFIDGNGRLGRLILALLLVHWGLIPQPLLYLSAFFEKRRHEYYDLLMDVSTSGAWVRWVEFFLRGVRDQSKDAINRVKMLQDLQAEWRGRVTNQKRASANLVVLVDSLFESPIVSIPQARELLGVTYQGAQLNVVKLVDHGILRQLDDRSYGKLYVADEVVSLLQDSPQQ